MNYPSGLTPLCKGDSVFSDLHVRSFSVLKHCTKLSFSYLTKTYPSSNIIIFPHLDKETSSFSLPIWRAFSRGSPYIMCLLGWLLQKFENHSHSTPVNLHYSPSSKSSWKFIFSISTSYALRSPWRLNRYFASEFVSIQSL